MTYLVKTNGRWTFAGRIPDKLRGADGKVPTFGDRYNARMYAAFCGVKLTWFPRYPGPDPDRKR